MAIKKADKICFDGHLVPWDQARVHVADELFFSGTAAEITPVRSVDGISIGVGSRGPVTEHLQAEFFGITSGKVPDRHNWLTPVSTM